MQEHIYPTPQGDIHYWCTPFAPGKRTLVFLPGLTADHRLFEKQTEAFASDCNVLAWDAPGHASSRPFALTFSLKQETEWLHAIIRQYIEGGSLPILVGQSKGGVIAQEYILLYPDAVAGIITIGSPPIERRYYTSLELLPLKYIKDIYSLIPWRRLMDISCRVCAKTPYGQQNMRQMMQEYTHREYCALAGHGFKIIAQAAEQQKTTLPPCPMLLTIGEHDKTGSCLRYCREWSKRAHLPLVYVPDAAHNANADNPDFVNHHIREFLDKFELTVRHGDRDKVPIVSNGHCAD